MKKKNIVILICLSLVFIISSCFIYFNRVKVYLNNNLEVLLNDSVTNLSFIKKVKGGSVNSKEETIDTTKPGKQSISIEIKKRLGGKKKYTFSIDVKDVKAPIIKYEDTIVTFVGEEKDLLKNVSASDDSREDIKVSIEGNYDFNNIGEYNFYYVAVDSSGNESREEVKLVVQRKNRENSMVDRTFKTSKGFNAELRDGILYVDGYLIANKSYSLPEDYGDGLTNETLEAFYKMRDDAKKENLNIYISSGFRSYETQKDTYNRYVNRDGQIEADTYSARAGHSEHQSGLAFDVNDFSDSFQYTDEAKWLSKNAYKYGFILRYPKGKDDETGYIYESWHFRYVGTLLASKLYNNEDWITIEDYFGITSEYVD